MATHQHDNEVHVITSAQSSLHDDMGQRMRKYLFSMSVRTVCFILAVIFPGPLRWIFLALAVVLPYVAVVVANAGPRRQSGHREYTPSRGALGGADRGRLDP